MKSKIQATGDFIKPENENEAIQKALSVWDNYKNAWRNKDEQEARSVWNKIEAQKYSMPDWQFFTSEYAVKLCTTYTDSVFNAEVENDYVVLVSRMVR